MCFKKFLILSAALIFSNLQVNADNAWVNHLRTDFLNNKSVIYAVNMRTFNAQDKNNNGIIDFNEGETSGTFINGINRLGELQNEGINALHLLPITPVGKTKALGTAGSLYSAAGFNSINPQLKDYSSQLTLEQQARQFINAAHEKGIAIIVDIPACGSYDLFLQSPELFVKDASGQPVIPADWTDVRLLNAGNEEKINNDLLKIHKEFVDYMINLGVDGIRADAAHTKPAKFWQELIAYSRKKDPQFLWLAESSDSWKDAVSDKAVFTPYDKLLRAGFDGFYGSWFNLKNWTTSKELQNQVNMTMSLEKNFGEAKSVIGSFTTHDELSPIIEKGPAYSKMIMWLNTTLPVNSYFVDGFDSGDKYIYFWANKKAPQTYTDDDIYFVHRGKLDIFNFSRRPGGENMDLKIEFVRANQVKPIVNNIYNSQNSSFKFLKTSDEKVFAYTISNEDTIIAVIGNMNFSSEIKVKVKLPKIKPEDSVMPMTMINVPEIGKGEITTNLQPGEIQVLMFSKNLDK